MSWGSCLSAEILTPDYTSESPGRLGKQEFMSRICRISNSVALQRSLRICIFNMIFLMMLAQELHCENLHPKK